MLCCTLETDWRELEVALDRLVSLEREASTDGSWKGIHNNFHFVHVESAWVYTVAALTLYHLTIVVM